MPIRTGKHKHVKIYRPPGTRYAEVTELYMLQSDRGKIRTLPYIVEMGIQNAITAFWEEFGEVPDLDRTVIETVCSSSDVKVTVLEIPDDT